MKPHLDFLPDEQYGFREKLSTVKQLIRMNEFISSGFYKKQIAAMLMIDVAKAFDRVWHEGLIVKLNDFNLPMDIIQIIDSYLMHRTFNIKLNRANSTNRVIKAGVPQGSILGPLLYIIYTSDFPVNDDQDHMTAFYADDTAVITKSKQIKPAMDKLQDTIYDIEDWCKRWRVSINAEKSKIILIKNSKRSAKTDIDVYIFKTKIPIVTKAKYLGLNINFNLTWKEHLNNVKGKAWGAFSALSPLLNRNSRLPLHLKKLLYVQGIRPIITYASPAWCSINDKIKKNLDVIQNKMLRIIADAPYYVRNSTLHNDFNLPTLSQYMEKLNASFFRTARTCTKANFNEIFNMEFINDNKNYSPITSFFLSDGVMSREFCK